MTIAGCTYEARHTTRVLRNRDATWSITAFTSRRRLGRALGRGHRRQRGAGHQRGHPRAEVLRGDVGLCGVAQVVVDVGGLDRVRMMVAVEVLEQVVTVEAPAPLDQLGDVGVGDGDVVWDATLADEPQVDAVAAHPCVAGSERRQAERAIGADVLLVADTDHRALEQEHHTGGDRVQAQVATREVAGATSANGGERDSEAGERVELLAFPRSAPVRVVAVLLAALRVRDPWPGRGHRATGRSTRRSTRAGSRGHGCGRG